MKGGRIKRQDFIISSLKLLGGEGQCDAWGGVGVGEGDG